MRLTAHNNSCPCCGRRDRSKIHRRRFLQLAAGAGLGAAFPAAGRAAEQKYEALLLICSDPRVWQPANNYMKSRELGGKFHPIEVDGGAIGLVAEQYQASRQAFWETLASAAAWQQTTKVIALNHRDCAAMKIAYGLTKVTDKLIETETHRYALTEFRRQVAEHNADLEVEIGLIALDGKVEMFK
jgi:carbonic anhydrase